MIELLVTIVVGGGLIAVLASMSTVILRSMPATEKRVAISSDITFIETWLPVDLASASAVYTDPAYSPTMSAVLPGTNVFTIERPDISDESGVQFFVSYRYLQVDGDWRLIRYEVRNAGTPQETVRENAVARELPPPPPGWVAADPPTHAVAVTNRNGDNGSALVGQDVVITFSNGEQFSPGGSGLSAEDFLDTDYVGGFMDPDAPPSRCGGTITLVLDTSGSVPLNSGGMQLEFAASQFIDLFMGTPVRMNVIGFDREAYRMSPTTEGTYFSLLNPAAPEISAARDRITVLDDLDGHWNQGTPDPNNDTFHWDQKGTGTNWEDALHLPFFNSAGAAYSSTPDLVVFVTDGQPTMVRGGTTATPVNAATAKAMAGRATSARIVGVLVGSDYANPSTIANLANVVGGVEFDATANAGAGNAADANYFRANFVDTADALRSIMVAQCGGTITLQKRVEVGGVLEDVPLNSTWQFSTDLGDLELNRNDTASVTIQHTFVSGEANKTVRIIEDGAPGGYVFDRIECSVQGTPVPSRVQQPIVDPYNGTPLLGADVVLNAGEAMSCLVISKQAA